MERPGMTDGRTEAATGAEGGKRTLRPTLTMFQVVFLGLAWMTPMIYFSVYGVAYEASRGHLTETYLMAMIAILFTARSYGVMAARFPQSGSAYTFAKQTLHPYLGFLVGWALMLDYLFSPIIAYLTFGIYIHAWFPVVPAEVWMVALNAVLTVINLLGIRLSAQISRLFVLIQIGFIALFSGCLAYRLAEGAPFSTEMFFNAGPTVLLAGTAIICFSFLGFDTATTLSEETLEPRKNIPRAVMWIVLIAGAVYAVPSVLTQGLFPVQTFEQIDSAGLEVVRRVGGAALVSVFMAVLLMAIFTQGLTSVTSLSRLMFVMGRESVLPERVFGYLHPRWRTPAANVLVTAVISLLALVISLDDAVRFVSFGALTAFLMVNVCVVAHCFFRAPDRSFATFVRYLLVPVIGGGYVGWLLVSMDHTTLAFGSIWLKLGVVYSMIRSVWRNRHDARRIRAEATGL